MPDIYAVELSNVMDGQDSYDEIDRDISAYDMVYRSFAAVIQDMDEYADLDEELNGFIDRHHRFDTDAAGLYRILDAEFLKFLFKQRNLNAGFDGDLDAIDFYGEQADDMIAESVWKDYAPGEFAENDAPEAISMLRSALDSMGRMEYREAAGMLTRALELDKTKPLYKILYEQLEICYRKLEQYDKAEECLMYLAELGETFQVVSDLITIHEATGNRLKKLELRNKIDKTPSRFDSENMIKLDLLVKVKDHQGAIDLCKELLRRNPGNMTFNKKLFDIYIDQEDYESAYNFSIEIIEAGHEDDFLLNLYTLYSKLFDLETAFGYARRYFEKYTPQTDPNYYNALGMMLVPATYNDTLDDDFYIGKIKEYYAYKQPKPEQVNKFDINTSYFRDIKVGLLSYDFCTHPVGYFTVALFKNVMKHSGMQVYCYYTRPGVNDGITKTIERSADIFRHVSSLSNDELGKVILNDKLDILIELSGHTVGNRIDMLAKRLAPVQITWMGFPCSTFTPNIDYLLGDYKTDPVGMTERFLTEKPLRMSKTYMCYPLAFDEHIDPPPCVKNGYTTFATLNNGVKLSGTSLRMWGEILRRMPDAKLIVRNKISNKAFLVDKQSERFKKYGINLEQVVFENTKPFKDYLRAYNTVDIVLDTYPYNGVTTTCEAFYMGVPIVSLRGNRRPTRCAGSLLESVGLGDLAVDNEQAYIEKAIELAQDTERLAHIRESLRMDVFQSSLCNTQEFRIELTNKLRNVYVDYCAEHKKPFEPVYRDLDELVKTNVVAIRYIKSLLGDNSEAVRIRPLLAELFSWEKALAVELIEVYKNDVNGLERIQHFINTVTLLTNYPDEHVLGQILDMLLKQIFKLV